MAALTRKFPFDGDDVTEAEWREMAQHWRSDGILPGVGSGMAVTVSSGLVLSVAAGAAWVRGHYGVLDTSTTVSVGAGHATNPRIDLVVLRLNTVSNDLTVEVVAGTAAATPVAPALTQTSATWEIELARVSVAALASSVTNDNITDRRTVFEAGQQTQPNPVRNASAAVAQRGTAVACGTGAFTLDGWYGARSTAATGLTIRQSSAVGDSQGSAYALRVHRDSGNSNTSACFAIQSIPSVESRRFAGRQVTLSGRVRKGANYSGGVASLALVTGTGTDEQQWSGFTGQAVAGTATVTPTTGWQTLSVTVTLASTINQLAVQEYYTPTGTAGANDWLEFKDVRIDEGPVPLPHTPLPYAADLAECQQFFYRQGGVGNFDFHGTAYVATATVASLAVQFPVTMRAIPTLTVSAVGGLVANDGSVAPVSTAIALSGAVNQTRDRALVNVTCGAGGLTVGRGCLVYTGGTASNGILDFSAEI